MFQLHYWQYKIDTASVYKVFCFLTKSNQSEKTANVVVIMTFYKSKTVFVVKACLIKMAFVFKRMPKERQFRVRQVFLFLDI